MGVVGPWLGGYTALAVVGGRPTASGHETPDGAPAAVPVAVADRVRALVLHAPAGVRGPVDSRVVDGAGHFSFLSPLPPQLVSPALPPSRDPPGFDRAAFSQTFPEEVRRFLDRHLR